MSASFTVLGAAGFIGGHVRRRLEARGDAVRAIARGDALPDGDLGRVICCVGVTADFRTRPLDTIDAHVSYVADVVRRARFSSSKTRSTIANASSSWPWQPTINCP